VNRIICCRICKSTNLKEILSLGNQALTGRFLFPNEPDPISGPLEIMLCDNCGLLQLSYNYELSSMYGPTYGYRSSLNQTMINHLREISNKLIGIANLKSDDQILDIGANDGTFLKMFDGFNRCGIDPSAGKFKDEYPLDIRLIVDFFSKNKVREYMNGKFKIISSIAMFYDINDPMEFMREVSELLDDDGIWFSEQGHMMGMINNLAYDSICQEHLLYYNLHQIIWMTKRVGLKIIDVDINIINGASFSFIAAHEDSSLIPNQKRIDELLNKESEFSDLKPFIRFKERVLEHRQKVMNFMNSGARVFGYGASTKGNVIIQYCNITKEQMPAIAEKYSWKYGREVPKSRIPIISEEDARKMKPEYFFVFPWHYRDEIIIRENDFINNGGKLVFPLPKFDIVGK